MSGPKIRIGSRGSALAMAQATLVRNALQEVGYASSIIVIETEGDRRPPDTAWGEGAFVASIERALLDGRVDVAVHSAKDIPTEEDPRLKIAAYLPRADARDGLVVGEHLRPCRLDDLPTGARVGTDSPRRTGFLRARRPDLLVHPLHGNVDTRLRRLDAGDTDALVLACAGLDRLELSDRIAERLAPEVVPPAPGQGAIAVQVRSDDPRLVALARAIDHAATGAAVEAERAFLAASGGGCRAPIGALATVAVDELELLAGYASPDGLEVVIARRRGPRAAGARLASKLAAEMKSRRRSPIDALPQPMRSAPRRVLVTRAAEQAGGLALALSEAGLEPVVVPAIAVELVREGDIDAVARVLHTYAWVVVTSANGARSILKAAERVFTALETSKFAAIGPATRDVLEREGIAVDHQPPEASATAMAASLPLRPGDRIAILRGDLADGELAAALRARGAIVDDVIAYRTREAPDASGGLLRAAIESGPIAGVVFTSGSTVRGLCALAEAASIEVTAIPAVCIGSATADAATLAGFRVLAVSPTADDTALARTAAAALVATPQEVA